MNLKDILQKFIQMKNTEETLTEIKFCNERTEQDMHLLLTEIRNLFTKSHPRKDLQNE